MRIAIEVCGGVVDETDRQIIDILRANARMPVSEIARSVGLSNAPVARRIE